MDRALGGSDKWGARLDSNLFATSETDRLKFARNRCDINSIVGDPLFIDVEKMDYRVKENSPALKIGFKNFPMDNFGVVSEKLKKIAKTPRIPKVVTSGNTGSGKIHEWKGAQLKNIETFGEQSAAGLSSIGGVALLEVPEGSELEKLGFQSGDVILKYGGTDIKNFGQLLQEIKKNVAKKEVDITFMHNQQMEVVRVKF